MMCTGWSKVTTCGGAGAVFGLLSRRSSRDIRCPEGRVRVRVRVPGSCLGLILSKQGCKRFHIKLKIEFGLGLGLMA